MNTRSLCTVFALMAAMLFLTACRPPAEVSLDRQANGTQVSVKTDQALTIRLDSNITTGYGWEIAECDDAVLKSQGEPEYISSDRGQKLVGGGGVQVFHFKPAAAGKTHLKLVYRRPWEKDVEPIESFDLDVTVP